MEMREKNAAVLATCLLWRRRDVEQALQVSGRTIDRLVNAGQLPSPILVGGSRRWRIEDIKGFIAGQSQGETAVNQ